GNARAHVVLVDVWPALFSAALRHHQADVLVVCVAAHSVDDGGTAAARASAAAHAGALALGASAARGGGVHALNQTHVSLSRIQRAQSRLHDAPRLRAARFEHARGLSQHDAWPAFGGEERRSGDVRTGLLALVIVANGAQRRLWSAH